MNIKQHPPPGSLQDSQKPSHPGLTVTDVLKKVEERGVYIPLLASSYEKAGTQSQSVSYHIQGETAGGY